MSVWPFGSTSTDACANPGRGRAAHCGGDERIAQPQAVPRMLGGGNVGEPGAVERRHEEVARAADAVAGEHAPRPVRAVRRRSETEDQQPRARIAEAWNRLGPVRLVAERSASF